MKRSEYRKYEEAVARFWSEQELNRGFGLSLDDRFPNQEKYFSHQRCDCCRRPEGGDKYQVVAVPQVRQSAEDRYVYEVCMDCYYYAEYGKLDDVTMMEMEEDEVE